VKNKITLQYGFVNNINDTSNLILKTSELLHMLQALKNSNVQVQPEVIQNLTSGIYNDIIKYYSTYIGETFRRNFRNGISEDNFTGDDYIDQIFHYIVRYGFDRIHTSVFKTLNFDGNINTSKIVVQFKDYKEILKMAQDLVDAPIVKNNFELLELVKEEDLNLSNIKVKENIFKIMEYFKSAGDSIKTITDVKRYVYSLDYNDIDNPRNIKLKTSEKRAVMKMLDRIHRSDERTFLEIKNSRECFKAMHNCIKPYSKFRKYKNALKVFDLVNYTKSMCTFNTITEAYRPRVLKFIKHLSLKPGILLRNMDYIIRSTKQEEIPSVIRLLQDIEFNPKLLIQIISLIRYRKDNEITPRVFNVKGTLYKSDKVLPRLENSELFEDLFIDLLKESLRGKEFIDKFSTSDDLKNFNIPFEMRDSSKFRDGTLTRGTRISFKDSKYLRLFTAWSGKNNEATNIDVDLSASFLKYNGNIDTVYYGEQSMDYAVHSGDFTCSREVKDNCITAEFIDIDLEKCKASNVQYAFGSTIVYSEDTFNDLNSFSGIMQLQDRNDIKDFINLGNSEFYIQNAGNYNVNVPFIIDFKNKEIIMIDKYSKGSSGTSATALVQEFKLMKERYITMDFSAYELLQLYIDVNNIRAGQKILDFNYASKNLDKIYSLLS